MIRESKILYVDAAGTDLYAVKGDPGAPWGTIAGAKAAAVSGDLVIVFAGTYVYTDPTKAGVSWFFYPGVIRSDTSGVIPQGLVYALGASDTPINLTNAAGRSIFQVMAQAVSSSWLFQVGNPTVPQDISDIVFYSSATGFFQWTVAPSSFISFQSSGGSAQAIQVQRSASYDPIDVISTNGIMSPAKFAPYAFSPPGVVVGAGAGTGGTVGVSVTDPNPSDVAFRVHLRTGSTALATGALFTLTFDASNGLTPYASAPKVIFSPSNANAATEIAKVYVDQALVTSAHFIFSAAAALTANTDYYWDFIVCG